MIANNPARDARALETRFKALQFCESASFPATLVYDPFPTSIASDPSSRRVTSLPSHTQHSLPHLAERQIARLAKPCLHIGPRSPGIRRAVE